MTKFDFDEVKTMPLCSLTTLKGETVGNLVDSVLKYRNKKLSNGDSVCAEDHLCEQSKNITIGELISVIESNFLRGDPCHDHKLAWRNFSSHLITQFKLNKFDWAFIPASGDYHVVFHKVSADLSNLEKHSVMVLDLLSDSVLELLEEMFNKSAVDISIKEVLQLEAISGNNIQAKMGTILKTKEMLLELGFDKKLPFLWNGSESELRKELKDEYHLSEEEAIMLSNIAKDKGWFTPYFKR